MAGVESRYFKYEGHSFNKAVFDERKVGRHSEIMNQFDFRKDDVFVVAYPKSGTVWISLSLRELYQDNWGLATIGDDEKSDLLFDTLLFNDTKCELYGSKFQTVKEDFLKNVSSYPSPRLFRSHLPSCIFPSQLVSEKGGKIIDLSRNPKDVCTSFFHFSKSFLQGDFLIPWEQMVEQDFLDGDIPFGPWIDHVTDWRRLGFQQNVLHVTYEEMKTDYKVTLQKIADFLQRPVTEQDFQRVVDNCAFDTIVADKNILQKMPYDDKTLKDTRHYFRKGVVGDWKNYFTVAQSELFDKQLGPILKENGIDFVYETSD